MLIAALVAVAIVAGGAGLVLHRLRNAVVPLDSDAVSVDGAGTRSLLPPGRAGNRMPPAAEQAWLATSRIPGTGGPYEDMARDAMLDLGVLTLPNGATVAGWSPAWRYVWPRDSAIVVAALAATGHEREAEAALAFLQRIQPPDGVFQARYLPDGSGRVPDGRGAQLDGSGWALWALGRWADALPADRRGVALAALDPLLDRSTAAIRAALDRPGGLPAPAMDYWEVRGGTLTLGTVAPLLAGLQSAARLYGQLGEPAAAAGAARRAAGLADRVRSAFGPSYPRSLGGDGSDAAVAMLLPPFTDQRQPALVAAWRETMRSSRRPAGGFAPGAGWKRDGISWTPETALYALTAATLGDRATATTILTWLDRHRTRLGALPEKVLADGRPAAVAPLAWTAAAVLLTLAALGTA